MKTLSERLLALEVRSRSFGFAVFEEPFELLDWGIRSLWHRIDAVKIPVSGKLTRLLSDFEPSAVVVNVPQERWLGLLALERLAATVRR